MTKNISKILVTIADDENSANGLRYAINLANVKNAELDVIHVTDKSNLTVDQIPHASLLKDRSYQELTHIEIIRKGEAANEILKLVSELEPELIIMSPDIFKKKKKYIEESDTWQVLKQANVPVLLITPQTEFHSIKSVIIGTDMKVNISKLIRETLMIFKTLNPFVEVIIFEDKQATWHFKEDVFTVIEQTKHYNEYVKITGNVCNEHNFCIGMNSYMQLLNPDIICVEFKTDLFNQLFLQCKSEYEIIHFHTKPILILPNYTQDSIKYS